MDPCPFVRLTVGNLGLKIPVAAKPARSVVHPSSSPCFCKIKLKGFPVQTGVVPFVPPENPSPENQVQTVAATFHLSKPDLEKLASKSMFAAKICLKISIYTGRRGTTCGVNSGKLLGKVSVPLDLAGTELKASVFHNGWICVGKDTKRSSAQFHLYVKAEPDRSRSKAISSNRFSLASSVLETPVTATTDREHYNLSQAAQEAG
ncbi:hypothetical protein ACOSP7_010435 [Xanthoceras sorbifolium]